jgi:hypothetical protein
MKEQLTALGVAMQGGKVKRAHAIPVPRVDSGASLQQGTTAFDLALDHRRRPELAHASHRPMAIKGNAPDRLRSIVKWGASDPLVNVDIGSHGQQLQRHVHLTGVERIKGVENRDSIPS